MSNAIQTNKSPAIIVWFTGLSGSGKTTLAYAVEKELRKIGVKSLVLDGDDIRRGLCEDLGFSVEDRSENIRRIAHINTLLIKTGVVTLNAFISPIAKDRDLAKRIINQKNFVEVYCDCPLAACENRDTKGLYRQARLHIVKKFTGIDSVYEPPNNPDLILKTNTQSITECVAMIVAKLQTILQKS